jgi:outer membrane protein, heavy metal efflux system
MHILNLYLIVLFGAFSLHAQAVRSLTLDEALELAARQHPLLLAGQAQLDVARAGIVTARAYPNPEAGVRAGGQTIRVPGNVSGAVYSMGVNQPLELGALRSTRIQLAGRGVESTGFAVSGTRLAVLSGVRRAFYQVLRERGETEVLRENLRLVEDLRRRIQVRVEVGEAGRLELVRADAEVATARTAASSAQLRYVTAIARFRAAVGTNLPADVEPRGELDPPVTLPTLEQLRLEVFDRNPYMSLARNEVRRAEARLAYENALARPQPSVYVEVDRPPDSPTYRTGINIPLPIWNKREGPIAEAAAYVRQTASLLNSRQLEFQAAIENAFERYQLVTQQLLAFEQGVLKEAEEALRGAQAAYQLGERGILEVLDAQRVLRTVRLDFLNAQFDRQAALIDLDELRATSLRGSQP